MEKLKAFMSYTRFDNENDGKRLTLLRKRLSDEVRAQTGKKFPIFQDIEDIRWGQNFKERIENAIKDATFLIPIITPSFFESEYCREELEQFLKREEQLQRNDLILPVYYIECPVLEDESKQATDELAQVIAARQYVDWRDLRFEDFDSPKVRSELADMARQIRAAMERQAEVPSEAVKTSVGELTILYDETRHRFKESNNQCEVYRIGVLNQGETTVKNVVVRITSITTTQEKQNDELRKFVGLKLCLSVNPSGKYSPPTNLPESSVILHPGEEAVFDFVRLCLLPGNYQIIHSNFRLNPQTSHLEQMPRGVLSPGKYTVTISAQGDDLNPIKQWFEFSSSSRGVNFRPVGDVFQ